MSDKFERRILVSVTGMTPQVVTETLYALATEDGIVPTEIHLITTANGRNRALRDLLDSQTGQFHAFCRDRGCTGQIRFDSTLIHVIEGADGEPLSDIRTPDDNTRAADLIVRLMQSFCSDEKAAVYVSLAGGRKTMSFFIGYALSLFGRPQDRLSHVLVTEPFENNRDFFYPSQTPRIIFTPTGEPLDASTAKVSMADIPFVRLRDGLPESLLLGKSGYSETVKTAQLRIAPPVAISFDVKKRTIVCGGVSVPMPPLHFATYFWLAQRCKKGKETVRPGENAQADEFLQVYRQVVGSGSGDFDNACKALRNPEYFLPYFQEKRSRVNKLIKNQLGVVAAQPYIIASQGKRLNTRYGLTLMPEQVNLPERMAIVLGSC